MKGMTKNKTYRMVGWIRTTPEICENSDSDANLFAEICKSTKCEIDVHGQKHRVVDPEIMDCSDNIATLHRTLAESDERVGQMPREVVGFQIYEMPVNGSLYFTCEDNNHPCSEIYVCGDAKYYARSYLGSFKSEHRIHGCFVQPSFIGPVDLQRTLVLTRSNKIQMADAKSNRFNGSQPTAGPAKGPCYIVRPVLYDSRANVSDVPPVAPQTTEKEPSGDKSDDADQ